MKLSLNKIAMALVMSAFAFGANAATDSIKATKTDTKAEYKAAVAHADADYKTAKEGCKSRSGNDKDVCMKEAKAAHIKATADAKAARKSKDAHTDAKDDKMTAEYKVAKEKCDPMSGDAKDACVRDAKVKYKQ